jgi:hypothetical protein
MTTDEMVDAYWACSRVDNKVVFTNANISEFFKERGLKMKDVLPHIGKITFTGACGTCEKDGLVFSASSRSDLLRATHNVWSNNGGICNECSDKKAAEKAAAEKLAAEQEAAEKAAALEVYRKSLGLKHGLLLTDVLCPKCSDGWLVVKLNSTAMRPFLSCSRFTPYRYSCDYTQSLALELHENYMPVFRARLAAKEASAGSAA